MKATLSIPARSQAAIARPAPSRVPPPPRLPAAAARCPCGGSCPRCSGTGTALAPPLRTAFERRLGASLVDVRLHAGADATHAAALAGAHAFTIGSDIYFAPGRFAPGTSEGATRLAHELVHVVQQRRGRRGASATGRAGAEREARALGAAVAAGQRVNVRGAAPLSVQRDGPDGDAATGLQLHLDPEFERLMSLQAFMRWWLGNALVQGSAPTLVPPPGALAARSTPLLPALPALRADLFAPLPPDPTFLEPDVGALFSPFAERGAPVGAGDNAAVMDIYRRNAAIAAGLPDLRAIAPHFLRPLIPSTWRRDIAGALTGAAVNASLKADYATPIEISDRAWQNMTGASTTVIPLPAISFDLF